MRFKNHIAYKWLSNKYVISLIVFSVWMLFLDTHSYLIHRALNAEIKETKNDISFYQSELETMRTELSELESNPDAFEKYAREKFWMHKEGERIVLIEYRKDK